MSSSVETGDARLTVLEVGCSNQPRSWAKYCGGVLFRNGAVGIEYLGLDLVKELAREGSRAMARTDVIYGNVAAIPLEDRVIDVALLRSVYGQFTGKKYHYFDDAVLYGPMELYRVLKPGGHVAVVEENTPWDPRYVESYFQNAGFEIADFQPKPEGEWDDINPDHPWRKLRERYYGDDQANRYHRGYHGTPYILVAKKPENAVDVTEKLDYSGWDERQAERFDEVRLYTRGERRAAPSLVH